MVQSPFLYLIQRTFSVPSNQEPGPYLLNTFSQDLHPYSVLATFNVLKF